MNDYNNQNFSDSNTHKSNRLNKNKPDPMIFKKLSQLSEQPKNKHHSLKSATKMNSLLKERFEIKTALQHRERLIEKAATYRRRTNTRQWCGNGRTDAHTRAVQSGAIGATRCTGSYVRLIFCIWPSRDYIQTDKAKGLCQRRCNNLRAFVLDYCNQYSRLVG